MARQFRIPVSVDSGEDRGRIFVRNYLTSRSDFVQTDLSTGSRRINFPFKPSFISISATGSDMKVKYLTDKEFQLDGDAALVDDVILDGESPVFPALPCEGVILDTDFGSGDQANSWRLVIW